MLEIKHIYKSFGHNEVLRDVSFSVENGQLAALLGENGAGKSTLLKIISGFLDADCGEVKISEIEVQSDRLLFLKNIGYVKEVTSLYEEMSVIEFLHFVAELRGLTQDVKEKKIKEVLKQMDLFGVLFQQCGTLSKGYRKRVELAGVLLGTPKVLLLDEPTEGLDPNQKAALRKIIKAYSRNHVVIISTHTLEDVELLADKVLLLHKGTLEADMPLKEFKKLNKKNSLFETFKKITED